MPYQPPKGVTILSVRLWLEEGKDDDILTYLLNAPKLGRAALIKAAMRNGLTTKLELENDITTDDISLDGLTQ